MALVAALLAALGLSAAPTPTSGRCRDGRIWTTSPREQVRMLLVLNDVRRDEGRPGLTRDETLDRMALSQAVDMACRNYFSHKNPERDSLEDRLDEADRGDVPRWSHLAEVLGTSPTADRQLTMWLNSRSHRRAVLERTHDRVGIAGVRIDRGSRYSNYWAVEFMARRR
jgi:uncharacterized protein YkwD